MIPFSRSLTILGCLVLALSLGAPAPAIAQEQAPLRRRAGLRGAPPSRRASTGTAKRRSRCSTRSAPHYNTLMRVDPTDRTGTKFIGDLAESWTVSAGQAHLHLQDPPRREVPRRQPDDLRGREGLLRQDHLPAGRASCRAARPPTGRVESVEAPNAGHGRVPAEVPRRPRSSPTCPRRGTGSTRPRSWPRTRTGTRRTSWAPGPSSSSSTCGARTGSARRTPTTGTRASPTSTATAPSSSRTRRAQVAAIRGERAMIQFRGFTPAQRDALVQALGNKITVQESPWNCSIQVAMNQQKKPFDDKRVRRALSLALDRYDGLEGALAHRAGQGRGRHPGAGHAVGDAARRAGEAGGLRHRHQRRARRGAAPAEGGRRRRACPSP